MGIVDGLSVDVRATGMEAADTVTAALLGGDDTAVAYDAPTGAVQVGADGGEGTDTAIYNGTSGDDEIGIARNGTTVAAFAAGAPTFNVAAVESLVIKGGNGNDSLARAERDRRADVAHARRRQRRRQPSAAATARTRSWAGPATTCRRQHRRRHRAWRLRQRPPAVGSGRWLGRG